MDSDSENFYFLTFISFSLFCSIVLFKKFILFIRICRYEVKIIVKRFLYEHGYISFFIIRISTYLKLKGFFMFDNRWTRRPYILIIIERETNLWIPVPDKYHPLLFQQMKPFNVNIKRV